jgi:Cof subfamily protein (haloacid dehalogenase superfamily)
MSTSTKGKLLFFDIDGTLVGFDGRIPESTYRALDMAKSNGHKIFICTGRSRCQIYDYLIDYGFDGIVGATGAYVEYEGKIIREDTIGKEHIGKLIEYLESENIPYTFQSAKYPIAAPDKIETMVKIINEQLKSVKREDNPNVFRDTLLVTDLRTNPEKYAYAEKAIYFGATKTVKEIQSDLAPYFEVTASSFEKPDDTSGEVTVAGINKASGMKVIGDYLGFTREDMIAFGDGPNDIDMLEYAGVGVAMGNAGEVTKASADLVTDRIENDGVFNALRKLELI